MHELSITQSMLNLALEHAERAGARRITRINLVIGELSGIVDEGVQFYFDFVGKGTLAEGAQLTFEWLPARLRCRACGHEFALPDDGPVIGVAWDGTGYGTDGCIWGGEFLVAGYHGFQRVAHLEYLPMPGGEAAIRNPYRLAIGYLYALTGQLPSLRPPLAPPQLWGGGGIAHHSTAD